MSPSLLWFWQLLIFLINSFNACFSFDNNVVFKAKEETPEHINTTHEDYSRLPNAIPSSMPIPEWYNDCREGSNGHSSVIIDDNLGLEMHHIASLLPVDIAPDHGRTPSSQSWDKLPGICWVILKMFAFWNWEKKGSTLLGFYLFDVCLYIWFVIMIMRTITITIMIFSFFLNVPSPFRCMH